MPEVPSEAAPTFDPGENCWRESRAAKGAFLLDSRAYFLAFRRAVLKAEREVIILAWDISQDLELVRGPDGDDGYPAPLADFLIAVLDERPDLTIRILLWDYSVVYLAEREWLPFSRWRNPGHPRLQLATDDAIDVGGSHHQKLVVIDGTLAFCGGMDLGLWRWDTGEHHPRDPRRINPDGELYQPYHDLQLALTGKVVDDLRELAAMRWQRATGDALPPLGETGAAPWPDDLTVDFEDEPLAIALTFARYKEYEESRHIERLHLEMIRAARRYLYLENQYLSSHTLVEALADRLRDPDGPEVVLVLTRTAGWAEEKTLGILRDRLLEILGEADEHGRLSSCFPHAEDVDGEESQVYVHAKLLIADDRMLLCGSANLSNRSMKVDSELDLAFLHDQPRPFIRRLRDDLLAMHFQVDRTEIDRAIGNAGSLRGAIVELRRSGGHRLRVLRGGCNSPVQRRLADTQLLDPDEPVSPARHLREALDERREIEQGTPGNLRRWLTVTGWIAGLIVAGRALSRR